MAETQAHDDQGFKQNLRSQWTTPASGWPQRFETTEANAAAQALTRARLPSYLALKRPTRARGRLLLLLVTVLALIAAACGDDTEHSNNAALPGNSSADPATDVGSDGGDLEAACDSFFARTAKLNGLFVVGDDPDAVQAYVTDSVLPAARELRDNAPTAIAAEADALASTDEEVAETGDVEALENSEVEQANQAVSDYLFDNCEGEQVEVELRSYEFVGAPDTLPATDRAMFKVSISDEETELHEMFLFRRRPHFDLPLEQWIPLAEQTYKTDGWALQVSTRLRTELPEPVELIDIIVVGWASAAPGDEPVVTAAALEPGEYGLLCAFPEGATTIEAIERFFFEGDVDHTLHTSLGMFHEFTVELPP